MIKKTSLAVLLLAVCFFTNAQKKTKSPNEADRFAGLDTTFERILKDWHAAGFAVAVVEKDKLIYAKGFGYRDIENKIPVTPNTLFAIGSCTKAFTASVLGILQKDGKLELNKPVRNYLPELKFFNDNMNNQILLSDLMSHRTGLPRHDYSWYAFPSTSRDSLMKRIQFMEPSFGVRERWQYNNFMFLLQGLVAEKITGTSWENNVREKIFKPLGMNSSNFSVLDLQKNKDAAIGYGLKKDSIIKKLDYYNINAMGPAGSINSNVLEMANWVNTWINGGKFNGKEIIPASYLNEAMGSQMVIGNGAPTKERTDVFFSNYGFGWMLASYKGHYRVEHGGNIDGFSASTCFFPTDSIGIVVLSNQNGSALPSIIRNTIADRLLKLPYFDWSADQKKAIAKAKAIEKEAEKNKSTNQKQNTHTSHPLKDYEGLYNHPGYGTFEVSLINDSLFCKLGKDVLWLRNYHYDIFEPFGKDPVDGIDTTDKSPLRVQFQMNEAGDISHIQMAIEPTLPPLKFTKTPKPKEITADELKKYVGDYDIAGAAIAKVYIKDNKTLYVLVPGQPDYELIPVDKDKFSIKVASGYFVQFDINDKGESSGLTFIQPNGNFKAKKK
ncbi:MAG: serine hydrolase [Chitinophagaceae bacterium]|nr:serine hydrolase [Chitinophagaceae bacterium]